MVKIIAHPVASAGNTNAIWLIGQFQGVINRKHLLAHVNMHIRFRVKMFIKIKFLILK